MAEPQNQLDFIISIGLDKRRANEAQKELKAIGDEALKQAKKIDSSYRQVGVSQSSITNETKNGIETITKQTQVFENATGQQKKFTSAVRSTSDGVVRLDKSMRLVDAGTRQVTKSTDNLILSQAKLALRAAAVVPIWTAIRSIFTSVTSTIRETAQSIIEIDKALQFAKNELVGFEDVEGVMSNVRDAAVRMALETGISVDKAIESFRLFKTAGIGVEESISGMETALKGALSTQGDAADLSKLLADVYNLMGDKITEVEGETEKFNFILSTMTSLMPTNVININEMQGALKNFTGVANVAGLNLDQLLTLVASSATLMQRGSRAGTQLARAFEEITRNTGKVESFLGRPIDRSNIDSFAILIEILEKANASATRGENVLSQLGEIFGLRSGRVIKSFVADLSKLTGEYERLINLSPDERSAINEERFQNATDSIKIQIDRLRELRNELGRTFVESTTGGADFAQVLKDINTTLTDLKPAVQAIGEGIGELFKLSKEFNALDPLGSGVKSLDGALNLISNGKFNNIISRTFDDLKNKFEGLSPAAKTVSEEITNIRKELSLFGALKVIGLSKELSDARANAAALQAEAKGINDTLGARRIAKDVQDAVDRELEAQAALNALLNQSVNAQQKTKLLLEDKLLLADRLAGQGANELDIELEKLRIMKEQGIAGDDLLKQQRKLIEVINKEYLSVVENIRGSIQGGISDLLLNEGSVGDIGRRLGDTLKQSFVEAVSGAFTDQILQSTGIADIFGDAFTQVRFGNSVKGGIVSGFDTGADIAEAAIVRAFNRGSNVLSGETSNFVAPATGSGLGGIFGGAGAPNVFGSGIFNRPVFNRRPTGVQGPLLANGGFTAGGNNLTLGQGIGLVGGSVLLGQSVSQQSGGGSLGALAGGLSGVGSALTSIAGLQAGAAAGSLFGAGGLLGASFLGPLGIAAAVGGLLISAFSKNTQRTVEEKTTSKQVASKIEVSNRKLELINRNLVAIRSSFETFALPDSAAFGEQTNLSDQFSINARR